MNENAVQRLPRQSPLAAASRRALLLRSSATGSVGAAAAVAAAVRDARERAYEAAAVLAFFLPPLPPPPPPPPPSAESGAAHVDVGDAHSRRYASKLVFLRIESTPYVAWHAHAALNAASWYSTDQTGLFAVLAARRRRAQRERERDWGAGGSWAARKKHMWRRGGQMQPFNASTKAHTQTSKEGFDPISRGVLTGLGWRVEAALLEVGALLVDEKVKPRAEIRDLRDVVLEADREAERVRRVGEVGVVRDLVGGGELEARVGRRVRVDCVEAGGRWGRREAERGGVVYGLAQ